MELTNMSDTTAIDTLLGEWIAASNAHDTERFLALWSEDAELVDPSVGDTFSGRERVREYFDDYFIGYDTQTRMVAVDERGDDVHVEVEFTGSFPEGRIGGTFDFVIRDGQIQAAKADLLR
jgi:uncharacterized protein (TIGR02246 family)